MSGINPLQFTRAKWNPDSMTDSNSLAQALLTMPEISKTVAYAFGDKYHLQYLTMGTGRVSNKYTPLGNDTFRWPLMGMLHKAVPLVAYFSGTDVSAPTANVGVNFTPFKLAFGERYFAVGDTIVLDSRQNLIRIQEEPYQDGEAWIYTCQLVTADATEFVNASDLAPGKQASMEFTTFEEYSEGGSSKETYPFWFENQMTIGRKSFGMSGSASTDAMVLKFPNGKSLWFYEREYQAMLEWQMNTERLRWYGKFNKTSNDTIMLPGKNGRPVKTGAGVLEQVSFANRRTYTVLTEKVIREYILDLMMNSKDAENKKFMMFTGRGGMEMFHQAMKDSIRAALIVDTHFVSGSGKDLTLGGQFITYKGLMGTEVTVVHNPLFDDPVANRELHPQTGLPLESYRFVILDFSMYAGESNISMVTKGVDGKDRSMMMWYTAGSTVPEDSSDSGIKKVMRSNALDGWHCHYLSETAIKIINPLTCGDLVCVAS